MKIIAIANQKGGVGKTTSTVNLGAGLYELGKKVLVIDFDPQEHLTSHFGIQSHKLDKTIYELLKGEATLNDVIIDHNGLKIIPSTIDMSEVDMEFAGVPGREFLLKEALKDLNGFDYVLIDCPPSLGILTLNAFTTASDIYVPLQVEYLSLRGMKKLLKTVDLVRKRLNGSIQITGVIATRYDNRRNLNREVVENIKEHFGKKLFTVFIRENIVLAEAPAHGKTIFEYAPKSHGAEDYLLLSKEIINRS